MDGFFHVCSGIGWLLFCQNARSAGSHFHATTLVYTFTGHSYHHIDRHCYAYPYAHADDYPDSHAGYASQAARLGRLAGHTNGQPRAKEIYLQGIKLGVTPRTFSVVGDCQSESEIFLGIYATDRYFLGSDYQYLQETIDDFYSSFSHKSISVRDGLSAPSALSPLWADPQVCQPDENPVQCELRLNKPMLVFINLGTVWREGASADKYEEYLRQIVELIIASGAVPILSTKADNVEGDHSINLATARVAYDYDIPLFNFWAAADRLPNHGLDPERNDIYLTPDAWDVRNFVALKTLDAIWRELKAVYDLGK